VVLDVAAGAQVVSVDRRRVRRRSPPALELAWIGPELPDPLAAGLQATDTDLEVAVRLQAAIWSVADALIDRRPVPEGEREALNALAAEPCLVPRLLPGPTRTWVGGRGVRRLMSSVARDAIDVFGGPRAARLKRCDGSRCLLLFVDTSRSGRRRWCSMERCGNRSKVAAHRRRRKENDS
jgi:predicted RNA-binding Zn ribbon-like protein